MQELPLARDAVPGYELEEVRARGGMGTVYVAHNEQGQQIALKVIHHDAVDDQLYQEQLQYEVQAARRVRHPNVVRVLEAGQANGHTYVAMELVNGPTLEQEVDQHGALSVPEAVELTAQIADALDSVHQQGLVHGDVTPSNILLPAASRQPRRALLTDFGLAKPATINSLSQSGNWTRTGFPTGTPAYMAPEQQAGERATIQTDVYNLGAVFLMTLVGKRPHAGSLANGELGSLPKGVTAIVARAMKERPEERFQTAAEFAATLRSMASADQNIQPSTSAGSMPHRHRAASKAAGRRMWAIPVALTAIAILLLAGIGIAKLLDNRENQTPSQSTTEPGTLSASPDPEATIEELKVRIDPSSFDIWDSIWDPYGPLYEGTSELYSQYGVTNAHAYGSSVGMFVYRVQIENFKGDQVELSARLSADAIGYSDPSNSYSDVVAVVNGYHLPERRVIPDDGKGVRYTWQFEAAWLEPGQQNQLEFRVNEDALFPNGLCIYGAAIAPGSVNEWITLRSY